MAVFPVLAVSIFMKFVAALWVLTCLVLILVILIQKGRGGGLSGAFGGGMAGGLLGSKTGDFLTWVTIGLVGVFLLLAVLIGKYYRPDVGVSAVEARTRQAESVPAQTTPAAPETPAPAGEANVPPTTAPASGAEANNPATSAPAPAAQSAANTPAPAPGAGPAEANKPAAQ
jgi:preprotein translocase subunit SecG